MSIPLVSICIPAYQNVDFLKRNLLAIEAQNFKDFELVISDDSPDDQVFDLIKSSSLGSKLIYRKNSEPLGSPKNWNRSISLASGKYVKIMHHDDFFTSDKSLEKFVEVIEGSKKDFVFSSSCNRNFETNSVTKNKFPIKKRMQLRLNPGYLFYENLIGSPSCVIFSRNLVNRFDENLKWLVDVDFYISTLISYESEYLDEVLIETTSNSSHQITRTCEGNPIVEIYESLYILDKYQHILLNEHNRKITIEKFHRIFDRFQIHSFEAIYDIDLRCMQFDNLLKILFDEYFFLHRIPYLTYRLLRKTLCR